MTTYPDIRFRKAPGPNTEFEITEDFCYEHPLAGLRVVPAGFVTDFASVPRWLWWLIPPHALGAPASVVHDDAYVNQVGVDRWPPRFVRLSMDALFRDDLRALGMSAWQSQAMYHAVRWFGRRRWRKYAALKK